MHVRNGRKENRQRPIARSLLDFEQPNHRPISRGRSRQAIEGIGRKGDETTVLKTTRRLLQDRPVNA